MADQFVEAILKKVTAKNKGGFQAKAHQVKGYLKIFVNALVENPAFDSQTKDTLTLKAEKFGSVCKIEDRFLKKFIDQSGVVDVVLQWAKAKQDIDLGKRVKVGKEEKKAGKLTVPKLEDANWAGGKNSEECTLILTEGDSAKALAVAGLSVVGRDKFGVFPLRGKLLNVRDVTQKQISENKEIMAIVKILGLSFGQRY